MNHMGKAEVKMSRLQMNVSELLGGPACSATLEGLIAHEAMHPVIAHTRAVPVLDLTVYERSRRGETRLYFEDEAPFDGPRCQRRLERARVDIIDVYVSGALGEAIYRCYQHGQPTWPEFLLQHFREAARGQDDLHYAIDVARRATRSSVAAVDLVNERVIAMAILIADEEPLRRCASVLAELLWNFRRLEGEDVHWAIRRTLDGLPADAEQLLRRLSDPRLGTSIKTGLPARHARLRI
jgi:hypothetical protein